MKMITNANKYWVIEGRVADLQGWGVMIHRVGGLFRGAILKKCKKNVMLIVESITNLKRVTQYFLNLFVSYAVLIHFYVELMEFCDQY